MCKNKTRESGADSVYKCKNLLVCLYSLCYVLEVEVLRETKPELQSRADGSMEQTFEAGKEVEARI
jgi:hypothetical protein